MARKIVIIVPGNTNTRQVDGALQELMLRGCKIVSVEEFKDERLPATIKLVDQFRNKDDRDRAEKSGLETLADVMALTAYEAWHRLGGKMITIARNNRRRGPGTVFKRICELMVRADWTFADLDPARFRQYKLGNWLACGVSSYASGILEGVEVYDTSILRQLTDEDIRGFSRAGKNTVQELVRIRHRFSQVQ